MGKSSPKKVVVSKDGPYEVSGGVPLSMQIITPDKEGFSWDWKKAKDFQAKEEYRPLQVRPLQEQAFLRRFPREGQVRRDGDGDAEALVRQAEVFGGPSLLLSDAEELCAFARFCDPGGKIWSVIEQPGAEARGLAIREANHCPAGRLVVHDRKTRKEIEEELPESIGVVEDPAMGCSGPLWVRGGIRIESGDGTPYEARNRVALCRCGASANKPFCNGSHASIRFRDGLVEFVKLEK